MKLIYLTKLNTHITMNRVIEFRVWDKDHKVMYNWSEIAIEKDQVFCSDGDIYISYDHCILMQFTGLTDKNGKKIFEGDIVKSKRGNSGLGWQGDIYKVIFDEKYCMFCMFIINSENKNRIGQIAATSGGHPFIIIPNQTEVIGNIYENSNLCNS